MTRAKEQSVLSRAATIARVVLPALALALACAPAQADVIYSTFTPSSTIRLEWPIGVPSSIESVAVSFLPATDYSLDSIDLLAGHDVGANQLTVYLAGGAAEPGAAIESWSFTDLYTLTFTDHAVPVSTATSALHPVLSGGLKYWVVLTTDDPTASMGWFCTDCNLSGEMGERVGLQPWAIQSSQDWLPAFAVNGTPTAVPEPATMGLLGLVLAGISLPAARRRCLAILRRRRPRPAD